MAELPLQQSSCRLGNERLLLCIFPGSGSLSPSGPRSPRSNLGPTLARREASQMRSRTRRASQIERSFRTPTRKSTVSQPAIGRPPLVFLCQAGAYTGRVISVLAISRLPYTARWMGTKPQSVGRSASDNEKPWQQSSSATNRIVPGIPKGLFTLSVKTSSSSSAHAVSSRCEGQFGQKKQCDC